MVAFDEAPIHCPLQVVPASWCIAITQPYFSTDPRLKVDQLVEKAMHTVISTTTDSLKLGGLRLASPVDESQVFIQNRGHTS